MNMSIISNIYLYNINQCILVIHMNYSKSTQSAYSRCCCLCVVPLNKQTTNENNKCEQHMKAIL